MKLLPLVALACLVLPTPSLAQLTVADPYYWENTWSGSPYVGAAVAIGDFDGNGLMDMAIGSPGYDSDAAFNVGRVFLHRVMADGSVIVEIIDTCNFFDYTTDREMGVSLAFGDFDLDGDDDLAIGMRGYEAASVDLAGAVCLVRGEPGGLAYSQRGEISQHSLLDQPDEGDEFGFALAVGDLDGNGYPDLAIGAPGEELTFGGVVQSDAGVVHVVFGGPNGLDPSDQAYLTRAMPWMDWDPDHNERFGAALAIGDLIGLDGVADLAIGAPGDNPAGIGGSVTIVEGGTENPLSSSAWPISASGIHYDLLGSGANHDGFGSSLAVGDFDGDGDDDLGIGIPGESEWSAAQHAGSVMVLYRNVTNLSDSNEQVYFEGLFGGVMQTGDKFGQALAAGDFNDDGFADLAIGSPFDDPLGVANAGKVTILYGSPSRLQLAGFQLLNLAFFGGASENDTFGSSLAAGKLFSSTGADDLLVGMQFRGVTEAGAVLAVQSASLFSDGFESGNTSAWN